MLKTIRKATEPLARRIRLVIGRAVLAAVSDAGSRQLLQFSALKGEVKDGVERMQQYGFTSHPLPGAQVLFVCVGGNRDHPVAISVDDPRYRLAGLAMADHDAPYEKVVVVAVGDEKSAAPALAQAAQGMLLIEKN